MEWKWNLGYVWLLATLISCAPDADMNPLPVFAEDKTVRIEFYTDKDFSDARYDDHYVKFQAGVEKVTLNPYRAERILLESTDWIAFRDLPRENQPLLFETTIPRVNDALHQVNIGYNYTVRIGETLQMRGTNTFMQPGEKTKTVSVQF